MPLDSKKLVKPQKKIKISLKIRKTQSRIKKNEQFLENDYFVHWASFDCKGGLKLTESRYEK